ncbi:MAG TPA: hypothetical protein VIK53_16715 [Verrucomicrobiae bacterium]
MKKTIVIFALVLTALAGRAALPEPDLIAQIHFAGAQKISAEKNFSSFTNEFCSAEALALRSQVADKLAPWLAGWLQAKLGVTVPDGAAKLRPLLDDLQKSEWFLEARAAADGKPEVAVAIKLEAGRAQVWQSNLKPFFGSATFNQSGRWLIFDSATGNLGSSVAQKISAPPAGWLTVDVNWPRLARWYPKLHELGLPETQFTVTAPDANLHVDGKFFFPENLPLNLADWQLPTNVIHAPFNSFTAVRGFASWLKSQEWAQVFQITPTPDQAFIWALSGMPFQTFLAVPVPDSAEALTQAYARLQPVFDPAKTAAHFMSPFNLSETNGEVTLAGVPFAAPFLQAVNKPGGQFLLAGAFENSPVGRPPPAELFQRLAAKNLVFYHWEITAEREPMLLNLGQLGLMLTQHRQLDGESAAFKWVAKITPTLGTTVTEVTKNAPDQMTFTRSAPGGFTAFELLALVNWIDAPNFPGWDLKVPPRPQRIRRPNPNAPVARPPPAPAPAH